MTAFLVALALAPSCQSRCPLIVLLPFQFAPFNLARAVKDISEHEGGDIVKRGQPGWTLEKGCELRHVLKPTYCR